MNVPGGAGYASDYSVLDASTEKALGREEDGLWLYRSILSPTVPVHSGTATTTAALMADTQLI